MIRSLLLAVSLVTAATTAWATDLRIGVSADYPPWGSVDKNGRIEGFDREFGDAVCGIIGANCTWENQAYEGLLPGLIIGKFDLAISAISITPERAKQVDFSTPYADAPNSFAVLEGSSIANAKTREVDLPGFCGEAFTL